MLAMGGEALASWVTHVSVPGDRFHCDRAERVVGRVQMEQAVFFCAIAQSGQTGERGSNELACTRHPVLRLVCLR